MLQTLKQLYSEVSTPAVVPGTGSYYIAGLTITTDLVVSSGLQYLGNSFALSHITGFIAAGFLLMLLRLAGIDKSVATVSGATTFQKILAVFIYMLVQIAIRGGSIASLVHFGLPGTVAMGLGILAATLIGRYSSSLLITRSGHSSSWLSLSFTLAVCVIALREC